VDILGVIGRSGDGIVLTGSFVRGTDFSTVFACLRKPLTHPENQKTWRGNMEAMTIAGPYDPSVTSCRWIAREAERVTWRAMRVAKKQRAKKTSERRRGRTLPRARTNVGISMTAHKQKI